MKMNEQVQTIDYFEKYRNEKDLDDINNIKEVFKNFDKNK